LTLYESTEGLVSLESNGITLYIEPKLKDYLESLGKVHIDYLSDSQFEGFHVYIDMGAGSRGCSC